MSSDGWWLVNREANGVLNTFSDQTLAIARPLCPFVVLHMQQSTTLCLHLGRFPTTSWSALGKSLLKRKKRCEPQLFCSVFGVICLWRFVMTGELKLRYVNTFIDVQEPLDLDKTCARARSLSPMPATESRWKQQERSKHPMRSDLVGNTGWFASIVSSRAGNGYPIDLHICLGWSDLQH